MAYRKYKADRLFDGYRFREGLVLVTDEGGTVEDLVQEADAGEGILQQEGILTPGFINCHCHLELSHLKNVIPPHTGLIEFLCSVVTKRGFPEELIRQEIEKAEKEMADNGIVAVGDIGNTADTATVKSRSRIRWQNFVEVLSFTDEKAEENIRYYEQVASTFEEKNRMTEAQPRTSSIVHRTSLVPHAPYSISPKTFRLLNELTAGQVISLHNQENPAEDDLYRTGGGDYLRLFRIFGMEGSPFPVTGQSSIRSVLPYFNKGQTILLVHNTSMPPEDVEWANDYARESGIKLVYCLCINANLYIENKVPPVNELIRQDCHIVLGTDSYSSNWQLSIASELQSLHRHFPSLPLERLLRWATLDGARALQWEADLGSFEKGKKPGLALLSPDLSSSTRIDPVRSKN